MMRRVLALALAGSLIGMAANAALAAEAGPAPPRQKWSFSGPFGKFDRGQLQRGFKVYREVCQACHGLNLLSFRNLSEPGGPEFSPAQARTIAAEYKVQDGPNDEGEMYERPGAPSDAFVSPFPNDQAARAANGGAHPPDLSLITKARAGWTGNIFTFYTTQLFKGIGGPEYVYSVLTGYQDPPAEHAAEAPEGKSYNPYFEAGPWISMPPPLVDEGVTYNDGTAATVDQQARDVSAFLAWAAEPKMEERKRAGFQVLIYMAILTLLLYLTKRMIWSRVDH